MPSFRILEGDWIEQLKTLPDKSIQSCVTSPPYWGLRDYGVEGQLGLEKTPEEYVEKIVAGFREVKRILRDDGTLWLNLGDSYGTGTRASRQPGTLCLGDGTNAARDDVPRHGGFAKQLIGVPWRVAFALQLDGWYLRQDIIWSKPNPMPESVTDRCTKSHEYIFLLTKSARYFYDAAAIKEPAAISSLERWNQDIENQEGSDRVPGKTNGKMKAVGGYKSWNGSEFHNGKNLINHPNVGKKRTHKLGEKQIFGGRKALESEIKEGDPRFRNGSEQWGRTSILGETRNKRSVWNIATQPYKEAHFATFPPEIPRICILAGSKPGDTILDPFTGSGTTGKVAMELGRNFIGCELNQKYVNDLIIPRLENVDPLFNTEFQQVEAMP